MHAHELGNWLNLRLFLKYNFLYGDNHAYSGGQSVQDFRIFARIHADFFVERSKKNEQYLDGAFQKLRKIPYLNDPSKWASNCISVIVNKQIFGLGIDSKAHLTSNHISTKIETKLNKQTKRMWNHRVKPIILLCLKHAGTW